MRIAAKNANGNAAKFKITKTSMRTADIGKYKTSMTILFKVSICRDLGFKTK